MTSSQDLDALASQLGLADTIVDEGALAESIRKCAANNVVLPTFAQLANPSLIPADIAAGADKNSPDSLTKCWRRIHVWHRVSLPVSSTL